MTTGFATMLTPEQRATWEELDSPQAIQAFLDATPYSPEELDRTPLQVIQDRLAHCLDGALFAAAALQRLGDPPILVDLLPEPGLDDDHVLAIFRRHDRWGALAKSNFVGLRYREPVYRSLHELVMSYFDNYFNVDGVRSLRGYTSPLHLSRFAQMDWLTDPGAPHAIVKSMNGLCRRWLLTEPMLTDLTPVDPLTLRAGLLVANRAGLYKPNR